MTTNTSESGLETLIESALVKTTADRSALTGGSHATAVAEDSPAYGLGGGAYIQGSASSAGAMAAGAADDDRGFCLDRVWLVGLLRDNLGGNSWGGEA